MTQNKLSNLLVRLKKQDLQTFENIQSTSRTSSKENLVFLNLEIVEKRANFERYKLMLDSSEQNFPDLLEELHESAERAFVDQSQQLIKSVFYEKVFPEIKKPLKGTVSRMVLKIYRRKHIVDHGAIERNACGFQDAKTVLVLGTTYISIHLLNRPVPGARSNAADATIFPREFKYILF